MALSLILGSTLLALLIAEVVLRLVVHPGDFMPAEMIHHPVLGHAVKPETTLHDEWGFRNRRVPERSDIVAIGDSFTYGNAAFRDQSWPHRLGKLLGEPVYNMGMGGYGPLHYLHLARNQTRDLKPRTVIVAFYLGNDVLDSYYLAHTNTHWSSWRESRAEEGLKDMRNIVAPTVTTFEPIRRWLSRNSVIYWIVRGIRQRMQWQDDSHFAPKNPDVQWAWHDPAESRVRTSFTPEVTLSHVDLSDARVREGLSITNRALAALRAEVESQGARLLTVLIPSKEFAYCRYLKSVSTTLPAKHAAVCEAERRLYVEMRRMIDETHGLPVVDTLGTIEGAIAEHQALYPSNNDSHFAAPGYELVARSVSEALVRLRK